MIKITKNPFFGQIAGPNFAKVFKTLNFLGKYYIDLIYLVFNEWNDGLMYNDLTLPSNIAVVKEKHTLCIS